jgi:hypothetical protein
LVVLVGSSPRLWDGWNRRGLISWHHQGAARLSVAEDAGAAARLRGWAAPSGHRRGLISWQRHRNQPRRLTPNFEPQKADIVLFFAYCLLIEKIK